MDTATAGISPATPVETPAISAPTPTSSAPSTPTPAPSATPSEPYLKVNDRTVYATREDAVKGYNELQSKYTPLSAWEKFYAPENEGGMGFINLKDPKVVGGLLDELLKYRGKYGEYVEQATPAAGAAPQGVDQLSPEIQAWIKTLREKGNFVTRDSLSKIEARLNEADSAREQVRTDQAVAHGTDLLREEMKTAGLSDNPALLAKIGKTIGDSMNEEQANAFVNGDVQFRKDYIKQALGTFMEFGDAFATSKNATYAAQKTSAVGNTPRPLPQGSAPAPATPDPNRRGFRDPELNRRVVATMAAEAARHS